MAIYSGAGLKVSLGQIYGPGISKVTVKCSGASTSSDVNISSTSSGASTTYSVTAAALSAILGSASTKSITFTGTPNGGAQAVTSSAVEIRRSTDLNTVTSDKTKLWVGGGNDAKATISYTFNGTPYNNAVTLSSNSTTIATISGATVTPVAAGTVTIKATPVDTNNNGGTKNTANITVITTPTITGGTTTLLAGKTTTWTFTHPETLSTTVNPKVKSATTSVATVSNASKSGTSAGKISTFVVTGVTKGASVITVYGDDNTIGYGAITRTVTVVGSDQVGLTVAQTTANAGCTLTYNTSVVSGITLSYFYVTGATVNNTNKTITTSTTPGTVTLYAYFKDTADNVISKTATVTTSNITVSIA